MRFETLAIHAGQEPEKVTGSVNVPIFQTSTYVQDGVGAMRGGHDYARTINPTRTALQTCLAALEGGRHGVAFSSGMAAISAVLGTFRPGSRVLAMNDVYGGTYRLFSKVLSGQGYVFDYDDLSDLEAAEAALTRGPKLVWIETPTNPLLKVVDIAAVAERAHAVGATVVVDNTFASPYLQNPLKLGADLVVHSTTKYVGGHSDVVGGVAVTDDDERAERLVFLQNAIGSVPGPLDCFLTLRGAKTLAVRMRAHCENAQLVTAHLLGSSAVAEVLYPGHAEHPQHAVAARQMRDFGGMVSFRLRGGRPAVDRALAHTGVWSLGESLGGVESLVEHPGAMTHASLAGSGFEVPDDLIRLSVGLEHPDDLIASLDGMLERAARDAMRRDLGNGYELDDDKARVDVDAVHAFLTEAYWARGRTRAEVADQLATAWRVVGAYRDGAQVGYARAISDGRTSAHLLDVYVLDGHRGHGVGLAICREICDGAGGTELRWTLHTRDAHDLYRRLGFREPTDRLLERWPDDLVR